MIPSKKKKVHQRVHHYTLSATKDYIVFSSADYENFHRLFRFHPRESASSMDRLKPTDHFPTLTLNLGGSAFSANEHKTAFLFLVCQKKLGFVPHPSLRPFSFGSQPETDVRRMRSAILRMARRASLTDLSFGKTFAISGSNTTMFVSFAIFTAYLPQTNSPKSDRLYSGLNSSVPIWSLFFIDCSLSSFCYARADYVDNIIIFHVRHNQESSLL